MTPMTPEMTQTGQPLGWRHSRTARIIGHILASISLLPFVSFWMDFFYVNASEEPGLPLSNLQWFKIMGLAVVLAIGAAVLRSKLWRVALPIALVMLFFVMYVMGS